MPEPNEGGVIHEGETGGIMDGAAEEAANLFAQMAEGAGGGEAATGEGQGPESPTGTGEQASGASEEGTPTSNESGEGAPKEGGEGQAEGEKAAPYDQDPKWKAARAAEAELNSILEEHGFTSTEDLKEALNAPSDQLGGEDPEQLLQEVKEYRQLKEQREAEAARQREEGETPEETIERLRQENQTLKQAEAERAETEQALSEGQKAIERYEKMASDIADKVEFGGKAERELALQLLGVGNPMDEVDLSDRKAVADALRTQVPAVQKAINTIRQRAIDEYAAGKSNLVPGKKAREAAEQTGGPKQTPAQTPGAKSEPKTGVVEDPTAEFQDIEKSLVQEILRESGELAAQS